MDVLLKLLLTVAVMGAMLTLGSMVWDDFAERHNRLPAVGLLMFGGALVVAILLTVWRIQ